MRYAVLIDGKPGAYGVTFPNLPGCVAMGKTVDDALANACLVLHDWFDLSEEHGEPVPDPRPLEALRRDPDVVSALSGGAVFGSVKAPAMGA